MASLSKAVIGKAVLLDKSEDKFKLYDYYLGFFPLPHSTAYSDYAFDDISLKKAELAGDISSIAAFKGKIYEKFRNIATYRDSTDEEIEGGVAWLSLKLIDENELDDDDKVLVYDDIIKRYQYGNSKKARNAAVRAFILKAEAVKDDATKLEIYSTIIEQYKDNPAASVKEDVDKAVAAKAKLELKMENIDKE